AIRDFAEKFGNFARHAGAALARAFEERAAARGFLARAREIVERDASGFVGVGKTGFGFRETIGGGPSRGFRFGKMGEQRATLFGELRRGFVETRALRARFREPLFQR